MRRELTYSSGLTANAVNHRIRKIKARANGVESNSSTPAGTPRKAQPLTPRKVDETKKRPRGEESLEDSIAVEDSKKLKTEMEQSMTTPQATPKNRKAEKAVKTEVKEKAEEPVVKVE